MESTALTISLLVIGTLFSSELLLSLPLRTTISASLVIAVKIYRILRSNRISDHWKEITLLTYAKLILKYSLLITTMILLSMLPLFLLTFVGYGNWQYTIDSISETNNLFLILAISSAYLVIRIRYTNDRIHKT